MPPVLLKGNISKNKLMAQARMKKLSKLSLFKNLKFLKRNNLESFFILACSISLFLEMFPLRTTGSIFSTSNITYIILISSILLSYKKINVFE